MNISSAFWHCFRLCAIMMAAGISLVCCSSDEPSVIDGENTSDASGKYLRISLSMPSSHTRSNPSGGEYGDGDEGGSDAENLINDLTLFIYRAAEGPNAAPATPVIYSLFVEHDFVQNEYGTIEKTVLLKDFVPQEGDRLIVAANYGNISYLKTLGDLRNHIAYHSWQQEGSPATARLFTMANAYMSDGRIVITDGDPYLAGSKDHPFNAVVSLERTAAKIDIKFPASSVKNNIGLDYEAGALDRLYLIDILPVNVAQTPSRLLKCVTDNTSEDFSCFGKYTFCADETLGSNGCQSNYVLEPKTSAKNGNTSLSVLSSWYGLTSVNYVNSNYDTLFELSGGLTSKAPEFRIDPADSDYRRLTLTYANENTQHASQHVADYLTGLLIKAQYRPGTVFANASLKPDDEYTEGTTFYRYVPHVRGSENIAACFSSFAEAEKYRDANPDENGTITCYPDAICYYYGSIRHSNAFDASDNHLCHPMEYAIVRNNVYIISFLFTGPGTPTPRFDDPESLRLNVYVRPWNLRRQSSILM